MTSLAAVLAVSAVSALAAGATPVAAAPKGGDPKLVARGSYLVTLGGCNDCHTPWKMGEKGPEPDLTRLLSGHPAQLAMPPAPAMGEGPWLLAVSGTMTAWAGPWGTSFTANLTPDAATGLGKWTEKDFVQSIRTGRHLGRGRPILPPMPVQALAQATDQDLRAIFTYLRSIPPLENKVPEPLPPAAQAAAPAAAK